MHPPETRVEAKASEASQMRGSNQSGMRAHNERLVLSLIRQRGPMAKAEIARVSGLSAQTVSVIMRQLEVEGLLIKGDPVRGKVGQPSVPMRLAAGGAYFLGLKIGRRSAELVLVDFCGNMLHRVYKTHSHPTPDGTIRFAHAAISDLMGRLAPAERDRIAGLGIAIPFFLWNWAQHLGVPEDEMSGWRDVDIRQTIAERYDFPVFLQNDASAACGAELVFGPSDGPQNFIYFYVGYFIGGGIVLNGALYTGPRGNAGAFGPMPILSSEGSVKQLIDVASLSVLEQRQQALGVDTSSLWNGATDWALDGGVLADWINGAAAGLAQAITAACSVVDFEAVLIDGWIPETIRTRLVAETQSQLQRQNLTGLLRPDIREGTIGCDARALGAASLPLSERFLVERSAFTKPA